MKRILTFFIVLLLGMSVLMAEEFTTGGIYVKDASENQTCTLISKTTNTIEKIVIGKTYYLPSGIMEIKTKVSETVSLAFSTGLQVKVLPNTTFSVDTFNQMVVNNEGQPSVLKAEYSVVALSVLEGEIELICPKIDTNSHCIVQTPLVNVNVVEGRFSIKSNPKFVMLNAIEGGVTVVDAKNRKTFIDKGRMGLIIPYPGRENEIMVTDKAISSEDLEKVAKSMAVMELSKKDILFAVIDSKIVGIRLK